MREKEEERGRKIEKRKEREEKGTNEISRKNKKVTQEHNCVFVCA